MSELHYDHSKLRTFQTNHFIHRMFPQLFLSKWYSTSISILFSVMFYNALFYSIPSGQTVEVLKSYVESEYGIPMGLQTLFLENLLMMDPLSLLDFAEAKGVHSPDCYILILGCSLHSSCKYRSVFRSFYLTFFFSGVDEVFIRVEGPLPSEAKKWSKLHYSIAWRTELSCPG